MTGFSVWSCVEPEISRVLSDEERGTEIRSGAAKLGVLRTGRLGLDPRLSERTRPSCDVNAASQP